MAAESGVTVAQPRGSLGGIVILVIIVAVVAVGVVVVLSRRKQG